MTTVSKLERGGVLSCYDVGHTWNPSCFGSAASLGAGAAVSSVKIYGVLYLVSALVKRRRISAKILQRTLENTLRSSAFLSINASAFIACFCVLGKLRGGMKASETSWLSGLVSSLLAICVESPERQKMLAFYVLNVSTETLLRMTSARGMRLPKADSKKWTLPFAILSGVAMYALNNGVLNHGLLTAVLRFVRGNPPDERRKSLNPVLDMDCTVSNNNEEKQQHESALPKEDPRPKDLRKILSYCVTGFARPFLAGVAVSLGLKLAGNPSRVLRNPGTVIKLLISPETSRLGIFLGAFTCLYRITRSALEASSIRLSSGTKESMAGFTAGAAMLAFPSSSVVTHVSWRLVEAAWEHLCGKFPAGPLAQGLRIPGGTQLLYAISCAVIFHAAVLEPQHLKPSYWKFLNRVTSGMIGKMNRKLMLPLGYESSAINPDFNPNYDLRRISPALRLLLAKKSRTEMR